MHEKDEELRQKKKRMKKELNEKKETIKWCAEAMLARYSVHRHFCILVRKMYLLICSGLFIYLFVRRSSFMSLFGILSSIFLFVSFIKLLFSWLRFVARLNSESIPKRNEWKKIIKNWIDREQQSYDCTIEKKGK